VTVGLNPAVDTIIEVSGFTIGRHQSGRRRAHLAAGKAANVARAVATLGAPCVAAGFVGRDEASFFDQSLRQIGVETRFTVIAGETRENITIIDPDSDTPADTHLRMPGFEVAPEDHARLRETLAAVCDENALVIFSGALPPGVTETDLSALIEWCRNRGCLVGVDSRGDTLKQVVTAPLWAIKPNQEELEDVIGRPLADRDAVVDAARAFTAHINHVMVTLGGEGAVLVTSEKAFHASVDWAPGRVLNTVGCGDAFFAGFAIAMRQHADPARALAFAVAVATESSAHPGPAEINPAAVRDLADEVSVHEL
jgi:1-phosphofructokinase family hexose kinase